MKTQGNTAPSWQDFVARITESAPMLKPDRKEEQWKTLYGVYEMGYAACLERVQVELGLLRSEHNENAQGQERLQKTGVDNPFVTSVAEPAKATPA